MKLETERLILRDFVKDDWQRVLEYQAVVLKSNNQLIGNCGVRMDKVDDVEANIGYEFDPRHWNHGYATEAAHAIVDFGSATLECTAFGQTLWQTT